MRSKANSHYYLPPCHGADHSLLDCGRQRPASLLLPACRRVHTTLLWPGRGFVCYIQRTWCVAAHELAELTSELALFGSLTAGTTSDDLLFFCCFCCSKASSRGAAVLTMFVGAALRYNPSFELLLLSPNASRGEAPATMHTNPSLP